MNEIQWRLLCTTIQYGTQRIELVTEKDTIQKYARIWRPEPPVSGLCHLLPLLLSDSPGSKKLGSRNWTQTLTDVSVAREPQACSLINDEKLLLQDSTLKYQSVVFFSFSSTFLTKKIYIYCHMMWSTLQACAISQFLCSAGMLDIIQILKISHSNSAYFPLWLTTFCHFVFVFATVWYTTPWYW